MGERFRIHISPGICCNQSWRRSPPIMKANLLQKIFLRLLSFCIILFVLRFTLIISFNGAHCNLSSPKFCFFSTPQKTHHPSNLNYASVQHLRTTVEYEFYSSIFQDFISNGFLFPYSSSLFLFYSHTIVLKDLGILNTSFSLTSTPHLPFSDSSFDFVFFHTFNLPSSVSLLGFALEIQRTLKNSGFLVIHTEIKDLYAFHSILQLFDSCTLIRVRDIHGYNPSIPPIREIILKKSKTPIEKKKKKSSYECYVPEYKMQLIRNSEPLIEKEPSSKPLKRRMRNVKYLTSMVDISFKRRYAYVDVGAGRYGCSIGSWFKKRYPKQKKRFEIYAIEANNSFHGEYRGKKGVTLVPFAAWLRNETLFFEINREATKRNEETRGMMGRVQPVQSSVNFAGNVNKIVGFDFAEWLKSEFEERDLVVMKMDVQGTEFHLIPRLIQTGALCLIDEIFLECHYNNNNTSKKYHTTFSQCLHLFTSLRSRGVLVHQWW